MSEGALRAIDFICVAIVVVAYGAALAGMLLSFDVRAWGLIAVPCAGFLLISAVRKRIDAPRPYELAAVNPLLDSSTHGKSFPSRHVGSGALIGSSLLTTCLPLGVGVLVVTLVLAVVRVVGRVHFVRDVVAGYLAGGVFGLVGMGIFNLLVL